MPQITKTIIGGAGSGKTSRLMAEIDDAAARFGGIGTALPPGVNL